MTTKRRDDLGFRSALDGVPVEITLDSDASILHCSLESFVLDPELATELVSLAGFLNVDRTWVYCLEADFQTEEIQRLQRSGALVVVILDENEIVVSLLDDLDFEDDEDDND